MASLATVLWAAASAADDPVERALWLVSQKNYSEARAVLEPLLQREPNAPRVRLLQGILRAREGHDREAIAIFERLRKERPDMFEPYNNLAVLYAERGRLDEAHEVLLAALERKPDPVAYANLGDVYMRLADRAYSRAQDIRADVSGTTQRSKAGGPVSPVAAKPVERPVSETPEAVAPAPPAPRAKPTAAEAVNDGPLVLLGDRQGSGTAEATESACVRAGKFKNRKAAAEAVEWIKSRGAEAIQLRHREKRVVKSYRVYLPALASAKAASAKLRELRGQGIRDVAIIRKGARTNQISLGVYRSKNNTERRVGQLKKLGYSARWAASTKTLGEYAVRARVRTAIYPRRGLGNQVSRTTHRIRRLPLTASRPTEGAVASDERCLAVLDDTRDRTFQITRMRLVTAPVHGSAPVEVFSKGTERRNRQQWVRPDGSKAARRKRKRHGLRSQDRRRDGHRR